MRWQAYIWPPSYISHLYCPRKTNLNSYDSYYFVKFSEKSGRYEWLTKTELIFKKIIYIPLTPSFLETAPSISFGNDESKIAACGTAHILHTHFLAWHTLACITFALWGIFISLPALVRGPPESWWPLMLSCVLISDGFFVILPKVNIMNISSQNN